MIRVTPLRPTRLVSEALPEITAAPVIAVQPSRPVKSRSRGFTLILRLRGSSKPPRPARLSSVSLPLDIDVCAATLHLGEPIQVLELAVGDDLHVRQPLEAFQTIEAQQGGVCLDRQTPANVPEQAADRSSKAGLSRIKKLPPTEPANPNQTSY